MNALRGQCIPLQCIIVQDHSATPIHCRSWTVFMRHNNRWRRAAAFFKETIPKICHADPLSLLDSLYAPQQPLAKSRSKNRPLKFQHVPNRRIYVFNDEARMTTPKVIQ
jgi:hypothetical protein